MVQNDEPQRWVKLDDRGYYQIWKNKETSMFVDAYEVPYTLLTDTAQLEKFAFRKTHRTHLVAAEGVLKSDETFICS